MFFSLRLEQILLLFFLGDVLGGILPRIRHHRR
jgi:hypothetical protein